jgi:hypothetical protein
MRLSRRELEQAYFERNALAIPGAAAMAGLYAHFL